MVAELLNTNMTFCVAWQLLSNGVVEDYKLIPLPLHSVHMEKINLDLEMYGESNNQEFIKDTRNARKIQASVSQ